MFFVYPNFLIERRRSLALATMRSRFRLTTGQGQRRLNKCTGSWRIRSTATFKQHKVSSVFPGARAARYYLQGSSGHRLFIPDFTAASALAASATRLLETTTAAAIPLPSTAEVAEEDEDKDNEKAVSPLPAKRRKHGGRSIDATQLYRRGRARLV
jgi:hypothetical protein